MSESALSRIFVAFRGVLYSFGFVALWAWLAVSVRRYDSQLDFTLPDWLRPVGLVVALAGAVVAALCITVFASRGRGTPAPFDPPREFVATGPYRYVRNPMYLGAFGVLLGAGLSLSSPAIVLLAVAFLVITHLFVLVYEEPVLAAKFGDSYERYKASVSRWIVRRPAG